MKDKRFERRYTVLKNEDIRHFLSRDEQDALDDMCNKIAAYRKAAGREDLEGIFIGSDWPEYENASNALHNRINGVKVKSLAQMINGCMGYIQNGTGISISLSQDEETGYFSLCAVDCGKVRWRENGTDIEMLFRAAYLKHAEKFDD